MSTAKQRMAWRFFDFANSAFPTIIITSIYVIWFKNVVVTDKTPGTSDHLWGIANSAGALIVFLSAPFLGAVADISGRKQHFLIAFSILCIAATALLTLTGPGTVALAMGLFIAALVGFEGACVFYNAFLPQLVPSNQIERLSGSGWALGYLGGLGALALCLPVAVLTPQYTGQIPLLVSIWFTVFAIPAFVFLTDPPVAPITAAAATRQGARQLLTTIRSIKQHRNFVRFLTSYFFYENAVATIIVFAVAFASDSLHFSMVENIALIAVMNVIAAPGALIFGRIAEKKGPRLTIIITLWMWLFVVAGAEAAAWPGLFVQNTAKSVFWGVAAFASLGIGAIQATSRAFTGQLAPPGQSGEFYGFMAFAGKGSAVIGPLVFGLVSGITGNQRAAIASIGLFFLVGLVLIFRVRDPRANPAKAN